MTALALRYQPESKTGRKGSQHTCPDCGKRKEFTRYVDTRTGELLPETYGMCNRAANCGYHFSPYHKTASGMSYADEVYEQWKEDNSRRVPRQRISRNLPRQNETKTRFLSNPIQLQCVSSIPSEAVPVHVIPDELFIPSLGHYDRNQFARLLCQHYGQAVAHELLQRFQIGTSSRWPGACVFWYIDEHGRKRGGQIKLFADDWHTAKYTDREGRKRAKVDWVHSALKHRLERNSKPLPDWLQAYIEKGDRSPCLFSLPQLLTAPPNQPVAVVEAPKTAVLCTPYFQGFVWLAVGALSYLNAQRLAPLRGRNVMLFPDLSKDGSAFARWSRTADELRLQGFNIMVSDFLELRATDEQKLAGYDLADYLLEHRTDHSAAEG